MDYIKEQSRQQDIGEKNIELLTLRQLKIKCLKVKVILVIKDDLNNI